MISGLDQGINKFRNLTFSHARADDQQLPPSKNHNYSLHIYEKTTEEQLGRSKDLRDKLYK